jgi:predicted PurR-regulated permease PerM
MTARPPRDPARLRLVVFVVAVLATVAVLYFARRTLLSLLLGLVLAYVLDPAVSWIARRTRGSRALATTLVFGVLVIALTGFLLIVVPVINGQLVEVRQRFPVYRAEVEARVVPILRQAREAYPLQYEALSEKLQSVVQEKWPEMIRSAFAWLGGVFSSVLGFLLFLLDLIFVPVFAFYLLVDFPKLKEGIRQLVPRAYRDVTIERLGEVDGAVSSYLRGQLLIAMILAAINGIGLTVIGVPMGLVIGIVAGLANMIPYMALVVGLAPALLLCWIEHQSLGRLIAVALVFAGAQMLEGTVLSPKILSKSVDLHPVWVLLSIIIGGRLFGLAGMLVAVPAAAAIQVFVRHWVQTYKSSAVYGAPAPAPATATIADAAPAAAVVDSVAPAPRPSPPEDGAPG